jgi:hydroxypyruvate reductase
MREQALEIYNAAVVAVQPARLLPSFISNEKGQLRLHNQLFVLTEINNIYIIGAGKASASMAFEIEKILDNLISDGVIATKHGHALPLRKIECIEAGHPVPDQQSVYAGERTLQIATQADENDIVIALISGGASALLADHPLGTTLEDVQILFNQLLHSGVNIDEMNAVRKHLSQIKGGGLSRAAYPATLVSFILSDVIDDPLHVIASGPTVADPTTFDDAINVLKKYDLFQKIPAAIKEWLVQGNNGIISETLKPGDPLFEKTTNHLIGTNKIALLASAAKAASLGFEPFILPDNLSGEARDAAIAFIKELSEKKYYVKPSCILLGGETTVTISGNGKGGRNQEFALAAFVHLAQTEKNIGIQIILSAGTDGSDGPTDATGAFVDDEIICKAKELELDAASYLSNNDAYHFFKKTGGLIITGPTQTNVMDIVLALVK